MIYSFYHKAAISATAPSITLFFFFRSLPKLGENKFKIDEQSMKLYKKTDVQKHPKIDPKFYEHRGLGVPNSTPGGVPGGSGTRLGSS